MMSDQASHEVVSNHEESFENDNEPTFHAAKPEVPSAEECVKQFADKGWSQPVALDYEAIKDLKIADTGYHGAAARYEWDGDIGDVAPEFPELEAKLFHDDFQQRKGEHISALEVEVEVTGPEYPEPIRSFQDAGLHPVMVDNIKKCRYEKPMPIQQYTIPAVLSGHDIVAVSQTGSGKTAAYLIPIISKLMGKVKKLGGPKPKVIGRDFDKRIHGVKAEPLVVIIVPTRELALQIFDEARRLCYRSMMRPCVSYGGLPNKIAYEELAKGCDILIGTPGRLCAMIDEPSSLSLSRVKYTVLDEADELVDQSWDENIRKIITGGDNSQDGQYLMFSATFPKQARAIAQDYMDPENLLKIHVGRIGAAHRNIVQYVVLTEPQTKKNALLDFMIKVDEPGRTMIFCNSKRTVDEIDDFLYNNGLPVTSIHSDRHQSEREDAMTSFRTGKCAVLVTTGVAARGWDIASVKYVINYDLPSVDYGGIEEYTHRIGRTARIGHKGLAVSFYTERNEDIAEKLVNVLLECECPIPDFLQQYMPEGGVPTFADDESDEEGAEGDGDFGGFGGFGEAAPHVQEEAPFEPAGRFEVAAAAGTGGGGGGGDGW